MELRVYVAADAAPLVFVERGVTPAQAPNARPWLQGFDPLQLQARTGQYKGAFSDQNASMSVRLNDANRQATKLLDQVLRSRAELYDGALPYFAGLIQSFSYEAQQLVIEIAA